MKTFGGRVPQDWEMDAMILKSFLWSLGPKTHTALCSWILRKKSELEQLTFQEVWVKEVTQKYLVIKHFLHSLYNNAFPK